MTAAPPKRRTAWIAVAAALALLAGVGAAAYIAADEDPVLPATAGDADQSDGADDADDAGEQGDVEEQDGADDGSGDDGSSDDGSGDDQGDDGAGEPGPDATPEPGIDDSAPPGPFAESMEEHRAWLACVTGLLEEAFADGLPADLRVPMLDECGDAPGIAGVFSDGFGFCLEPDATDEAEASCVFHDEGWVPFDDLPDLSDLPDLGLLPGLGEWRSLEDVCTSESDETSVDVVCVWPPCDPDDADCPFPPACDEAEADSDADDGAPVECFGFDFGFGVEIDPGGHGFDPFGGSGSFFFDFEGLPDTLPDLPGDFDFPDDLPPLDDWFDDFPWADEFEDLFGEPEPTDA